jgi:hypothetical protein
MGGFVNQTATRRQAFGRRTAPPSSAAFFESTPSAPPDPVSARDFDTRAVISRSFSLMGRNGVTFLALVAAAAVPNRMTYRLLDMENPAVLLFYYATTVLACVPLYAAIFSGATKTLQGEKITFQSCFRAGTRQPLPAALLSLMTSMFVCLLLIVPGFTLATRWAVAAPVALVDRLGIRASLARSAALTAPHRPQVAVLVLLLAGLAGSRAMPMLPIWHVPLAEILPFMWGNWLFPLLLTAFTAAAGASLYHELCQSKPADSELPPIVQPVFPPQDKPRVTWGGFFQEGTSRRKKIAATLVMYAHFLAVELVFASRLFQQGKLATYGIILLAAILGSFLVWFKIRKVTDPDFAAKAAARKANRPAAKASAGWTALYLALFQLLFVLFVLTIRHGIAFIVPAIPAMVVATMAATALAGAIVVLLMALVEKRRRGATAH